MTVSSGARVVGATPEVAYAAFMDPAALLAWLPPGDMRGRLHAFDAREGGGYEMSLHYVDPTDHPPGKSGVDEDRVVVRFLELVPAARIVESARFVTSEPALGGEMRIEITFAPAAEGTLVTMRFSDLPAGLRPEDNDVGVRQSLDQLARYLAGGGRRVE